MHELLPDLSAFRTHYDKGDAQLVWLDLICDLETPVAAYLKIAREQTNSFLLESVEDGDVKGRYSIIGLKPDLIFRIQDGVSHVCRDAQTHSNYEPIHGQPLDALRLILDESKIDMPDVLPSMAAGIFGYLSYDMVKQMERLPDVNPRHIDVPDCLFIRPTIIAVYDTITDNLKLVTPVRQLSGVTSEEAYYQARTRLFNASMDLNAPIEFEHTQEISDEIVIRSNTEQQEYHQMVNKAREYIMSGDIFQVVLSQRFEADFTLPAFDLYRALRRVNPSPYLFFLNFETFSVIGSSPEVLVGVKSGRVNIRPIAGTRKRGKTDAEDAAIAAELLADEKERAEHLMLLDLGRNDVGRVSKIGTVCVNEAFQIQKTSHLIHIVSDVSGQLRDDMDVIDALQAGFPAGTVSGAPKIRAMEIIDELEKDKRGIYAGCVGYFSAGGEMDTCIALRTGIIKDNKLYVQAGGGVVYDSTAEGEFEETVNKAKALFRAAEEAVRVASTKRNTL